MEEINELREINENLEKLLKSIGKGYLYDLSELIEKIVENTEKQNNQLEKINARLDSIENTIENK